MTDDLISRQAAIDFIDAGHLCNPNEPRWSDNEIVNFLKSRTSAQTEIVRCKDCCYWSGLPKEELALCSVYDNVYAITPRDGFCHKGRRSE
jgi:hypothetical protein